MPVNFTRLQNLNLCSAVPPEKVLMLDERGVHIPDYILGPYNEDSSINITCVSIGGNLRLFSQVQYSCTLQVLVLLANVYIFEFRPINHE